MNLGSAIAATFTNQSIVSAITSTIFIIMLGYYLRKRGVFGPDFGKVLTKVVLSVAIAALSFNSFMQNINATSLRQGLGVLVWGIVVYILLIVLTPLLYVRQGRDRREVLAILTTFGSTTFFGIPIVGAIYGTKGVLYSSIFNIGYRIFLYSYAYIKMSGLKLQVANLKKMLVNPIVIATLLGFILWLIQGWMPQVMVPLMDSGTAAGGTTTVAFYRIDQTAVWLWRPLNYLATLASPLAWLAIGCTLGSISLTEALENKLAWFYAVAKVGIVPLFNLVVLLGLTSMHVLTLDYAAIATVVIMMATPTATVAAAYAISYDRQAVLTSNASLLSTVAAVVLMPLWIAVLGVLHAAGMI